MDKKEIAAGFYGTRATFEYYRELARDGIDLTYLGEGEAGTRMPAIRTESNFYEGERSALLFILPREVLRK